MNTGSAFLDMMQFLVSAFRHILVSLDSAILFGNTSVLDLNIALTVFTIIFVAVFAVVRSGVVNSMGSVKSERSRKHDSDD